MSNFSNHNLDELKNEVKTEAYRLGFSHIGFTTPSPPDHADIFMEWLNNGYAASMTYLARPDTIAKRLDPKNILPSCEAIIVLVLPYPPSKPSEANSGHPKIASYAVGSDYHTVVPNLLESIISKIENKISSNTIEYRIYTDTGPILERELASRAGLGWIGKNSCLINPGSGSFFFLSEILINIPFEPDEPFIEDFCGKCNKCVESCPTSCILPNRTIDSNRCISFLTIENKNEIQEELRGSLNGWVFGCDICQQVCPWNLRFAKISSRNYFDPIDVVNNFSVQDLLSMDQIEFNSKFSESPISRAKLYGIKRNLLVFSAFHFSKDLIKPIQSILDHEENEKLVNLAKWVFLKNGVGS